MSGIFATFIYMYHRNQPDVGKYTINGSYGGTSFFPREVETNAIGGSLRYCAVAREAFALLLDVGGQ